MKTKKCPHCGLNVLTGNYRHHITHCIKKTLNGIKTLQKKIELK